MTTIVKFTFGGYEGYICRDVEDRSGEYVPLTEYQALKTQYQELADSSGDAITQMVGQRKRRREAFQKVIDTLLILIKDCQEAL